MNAQEQLKEAIGELISNRPPRPMSGPMPYGSTDPADRLRTVETDLAKLYEGLFVLARQIDELRGAGDGS